jgi:hypothetical protein
MNDNDCEILLYRILTGETYFTYNDQEYCLVSPSKDVKYKGLRLYNSILNEEKFQDWLREENLTKIMIALGVWDVKTDDVLKGLEKSLDELKLELYKAFVFPSQQPRIRKSIEQVRKNINKLYVTKHEFLTHTLEGYANSLKNEYIICQTLYRDSRLVFSSTPDNNSSSYSQFNSLIREIDNLIITTDKYKLLARNNIWKSYWNANKYGDLFNGSISNTTEEQRALINISRMYDNIYEHPECPDDKIIEDDDMLDGWMIFQKKKREKDKKQEQFLGANGKMKNASEIFMMAKGREEAEEILDLNSDDNRSLIKNKINYINQKGYVEEKDLPDVQVALQQQISELNKRRK